MSSSAKPSIVRTAEGTRGVGGGGRDGGGGGWGGITAGMAVSTGVGPGRERQHRGW